MARYSVVVFKEGSAGKDAEPFLASRDPELVKAVRDFISSKLQAKTAAQRKPDPLCIIQPTEPEGR